MSENQGVPATVRTKVSMSMKVIRKDGTVEDHGVQSTQIVELDYENAVNLLGQENADELFRGARERTDDGDSAS